MVGRREYAGLPPTHDGMGYFGFNEPCKAYIEVVSFDRLVNVGVDAPAGPRATVLGIYLAGVAAYR